MASIGIVAWEDVEEEQSRIRTALLKKFPKPQYDVLVTCDSEDIDRFLKRTDLRIGIFDIMGTKNAWEGFEEYVRLCRRRPGMLHIAFTQVPEYSVRQRIELINQEEGPKLRLHDYVNRKGTSTTRDEECVRLIEVVEIALQFVCPSLEPHYPDVSKQERLIAGAHWEQMHSTELCAALNRSAACVTALSSEMTQWLQLLGRRAERLCGVLVGSVGRLEAFDASDVDFFFAFDDSDLSPKDPAWRQTASDAYDALNHAAIFLKQSGRGVTYPFRKPKDLDGIDFAKDHFPSFFPLSLIVDPDATEAGILLRRQCFLIEGTWFYNQSLFKKIRSSILPFYSIDNKAKIRVNANSQTLWSHMDYWLHGVAFETEEFRQQPYYELKFGFIRLMSVIASKLFIVVANADSSQLNLSFSDGLQLCTGAKFSLFMDSLPRIVQGGKLSVLRDMVHNLFTIYVTGISLLGDPTVRKRAKLRTKDKLVDSLLQMSREAEKQARELMEELPKELLPVTVWNRTNR